MDEMDVEVLENDTPTCWIFKNVSVTEDRLRSPLDSSGDSVILNNTVENCTAFPLTLRNSLVDDFGEFGEADISDALSLQDDDDWCPDAISSVWQSIDIFQFRMVIEHEVYTLLEPMWEHIDTSQITYSEDIRQLEGSHQILSTPERYNMVTKFDIC